MVDVLMIGTGEYTTGYVDGSASKSDKGAGVVALSVFDFRRRGKVSRVGMVGVSGSKFPGIRRHMEGCIRDRYEGMEVSCETWPADGVVDPNAYKTAIATYKRGDVAIIFTPDDTHYDIAVECIRHGMHVMVTKPIVKTLAHHLDLIALAKEHDVLVCMEVHKRLDPFYADARDRAATLGNLNYLVSYMSQPKHQLDTFRAWAGKSSDISYYLNSHHVDFSEWVFHGKARPIRVTGTGSTGVATSRGIATEDSITLTVQWQNLSDSSLATCVYTASWAAPKSDVHSQQRFFMMLSEGEVTVDQAHRGYTVAKDDTPFASCNPLFMKYTPTNGKFAGQGAYGYRSLEAVVDAAAAINEGAKKPEDYDDGSMATAATTTQGTAILEAGRRSLDEESRPYDIIYEDTADGTPGVRPVALRPHVFKDK